VKRNVTQSDSKSMELTGRGKSENLSIQNQAEESRLRRMILYSPDKFYEAIVEMDFLLLHEDTNLIYVQENPLDFGITMLYRKKKDFQKSI